MKIIFILSYLLRSVRMFSSDKCTHDKLSMSLIETKNCIVANTRMEIKDGEITPDSLIGFTYYISNLTL